MRFRKLYKEENWDNYPPLTDLLLFLKFWVTILETVVDGQKPNVPYKVISKVVKLQKMERRGAVPLAMSKEAGMSKLKCNCSKWSHELASCHRFQA